MKNILRFIPGFRTQTKWKMIVSGIYYLLSLIMITSGVGLFLFCITIPFILFSLVSLIKNKGARRNPAIALAMSFILFCAGMSMAPTDTSTNNKQIKVASNVQSTKSAKIKKVTKPKNEAVSIKSVISGKLKIHYINVGQGDSELIQSNGKNMLIDTGTNESTGSLISYLKSQNVSKIDYLVLTHPHEDHIGGADAVINEFNVEKVYMPKATTTTKTFKDVIQAMKNKGLKASVPTVGEEFIVGAASCKILSPINVNKEDLNTYSIVLKVTFGSNKFLFTGDAQASNEEDMINKSFDLSADVLKVGHHGSHTSTLQAFLDKVNPKFAVISCGKNNDYGHPHSEAIDKLKAKNIPLYRTDESGTIVCTSDGKSISFSCNPGSYTDGAKNQNQAGSNNSNASTSKTSTSSSTQSVQQPSGTQQSSNNDRIVYYTPNGKSYHYDSNCVTLKRSKTILSGKLSDVINMGKSDPCDKCVH